MRATPPHARTTHALPYLLHQSEGALCACVPPSARSHSNQAVGAFGYRFVGERVADDVVQHDAAAGVGGGVDVLARAEGRDVNGHTVPVRG